MLNHFTMEVFPSSEENRTKLVDYLRGYQAGLSLRGEEVVASLNDETLLLAGQNMNASIDQLMKFVHKFAQTFSPEKVVLDYSATIPYGEKEITHRASNIEIKTS
jgi:hypothetical protein